MVPRPLLFSPRNNEASTVPLASCDWDTDSSLGAASCSCGEDESGSDEPRQDAEHGQLLVVLYV
eukprot:CAMPEP_0172877724 /NCGR_PEP_ID=MMETSP1075-20121228/107744_1 /TAXON_ID=2916 /ORGANISM="Ceratium fusus, Strain PA161109" /LENGTH=63 /DNA_ID=CAMNT_0013729343 /DNA_START=117 /DNA_END=308 /DNA_ORIENTATION=-